MSNTSKKIVSIIGIVIGVIIIIIGFSLQNTSSYAIGKPIAFGGDFYTEMYDVTKDVGRAINNAINDLIYAISWLIISLGAIDICFFVYKLVKASEVSAIEEKANVDISEEEKANVDISEEEKANVDISEEEKVNVDIGEEEKVNVDIGEEEKLKIYIEKVLEEKQKPKELLDIYWQYKKYVYGYYPSTEVKSELEKVIMKCEENDFEGNSQLMITVSKRKLSKL